MKLNDVKEKIKKYYKGVNIKFLLYAYKYNFNNPQINYATVKYGKSKFLKKYLKRIIKKYQKGEKGIYCDFEKIHLTKFPIWFCWFQGIENAPDIVKICQKSLEENIDKDKQEIHYITLKNVDQYIKIPKHIKEKFEKNIISYTFYSDFIRTAILAKYGGFWIDSTVLVTENISSLCNYEYYTKKSDRIEDNFGNYLIQGRFAIHLLKLDNDNMLINFLYDALYLYYKKFNIPVDYFMTNLIVDIAYNNLKEVRKMMDELPVNDRGLEARLCENLNNKFSQTEYDVYCQNMPFQKLSNKLKNYNLLTEKGEETFFGKLKNKYLK